MDDVLRIDLAEIARLRDAGFTAVELIRLVDVKRRHQREQMLKRVAGRQRPQLVRWLVRRGWFGEFDVAAAKLGDDAPRRSEG